MVEANDNSEAYQVDVTCVQKSERLDNWRPPLWQTLGASGLSIALFGYIRLVLYSQTIVPLTSALPLLLTLWHRNRKVHYVMAGIFSVMSGSKVFLVDPPSDELTTAIAVAMMLVNIWTVAIIVDVVVIFHGRLKKSYVQLGEANGELAKSNIELAGRDQEISSQNEALQRQTHELEQQMDALQRQAEALQQQSAELQELQAVAVSREKILQSLFNTSAGRAAGEGSDQAMVRVCEAAIEAFGKDIVAALLLERIDNDLIVRGHCGFASSSNLEIGKVYSDDYVRSIIEIGQTRGVDDLSVAQGMRRPQVAGDSLATTILVSPLVRKQVASGAIVVYGSIPRAWSEGDYQKAEWLASQGALLLEAIKLQEEIDRRTRETEEASKRKTQFLAAVSHDVRTPANVINLMAEVIGRADQSKEAAEELPELIRGIRVHAKQLVELVTDVLDISRLDSGKVEIEKSEFDFCQLIRTEVAQYRVLAEKAGLKLRCEVADQPIWIQSDRMKLIRVVGNLIGNAIKFTERGTVTVRAIRFGNGAELQVEDTGVGIPAESLGHVFDEFYQVKNPERDRSKGTGLGLAICRRLIDALDCSMSVKSTPGKGTTFYVSIPQDSIIEGPGLPRVASPLSAYDNLSGLNVLLVEDHQETRVAAARLLRIHGAKVHEAATAQQGIDVLPSSGANVVLLDLMLPDMDGREVLRFIQANRPESLRLVLVVSGDNSQVRTTEVTSLGADELVAKPVDFDALVHRLTRLLPAYVDKDVGEFAESHPARFDA